MKSSLKNMVLTLLLITLASATLLGLIYSVTKAPIEAARGAKTVEALSSVMPEFDNDPTVDTVTVNVDGIPTLVYTGKKGNSTVGYAVESLTKNGFSGEIKMMTGFLPNGDIYNIEVLQHNETPGLGSKMTDPGNVLLVSFQGKNPADLNMTVRKDGGDIDALTASTISSRAYAEAVERAYKAFQEVALGISSEGEAVDHVARVLLEHDNDPRENPETVDIDGTALEVYTGRLDGEISGYAVRTSTDKGYNGLIELMVGFVPNGEIYDIAVVSQEETPGLGGLITKEDNPLAVSFIGKNPGELKMSLKAEGGDIDGISASTITSDAYIEAVSRAYQALLTVINREER